MKLLNHIFILIGILSLSYLLSCSHHPYAGVMDKAEALMEEHPDSAFALLNTVNKDSLGTETDKARYALLMSMALDKNYIDTTEFDVLQPAIDYYLKHGSPDEKLRTYYYQGRVYQNNKDYDQAMNVFTRADEIAKKSSDTLTLARTLVAQAFTYHELYDFNNYIKYFLKAAHQYHSLGKFALEFDCHINALNGSFIMENKPLTDSLMHVVTSRYANLEDSDYKRLQANKLRYAIMFQGKNEVQTLIDSLGNNLIYDTYSIIDLARAYQKLENPDKALEIMDYVKTSGMPYDTLKFLSVTFYILEEMQDYVNALSTYKQFSSKIALTNRAKFNQKVHSLDEKNRIELDAQKDAERRTRIIWGCVAIISILLLLIALAILLLNKTKLQKNLAKQRARAAELENETLKYETSLAKSEANLAEERAHAAELENDKLKYETKLAKTEAALAKERALSAELKNDNLKYKAEIAKTEANLAKVRARTAELENDKLKSETKLAKTEADLARKKERSTSLENQKLKSQSKKLAIEKQQFTLEKKILQLERDNETLEADKLRYEKNNLAWENKNLQMERNNKALETENLQNRINQLENESQRLKELLKAQGYLPEEVKETLRTRMEMLNANLARYITDNDKYKQPYESWVKELTENAEAFMNSNRLAFQASHPRFIKYFEDHNLTPDEINYLCLYAIGLHGKEVGIYMKKRSHVNLSSAIRKKLGIDKHETNIGIYVRRLLKDL